MSGQIGFALLGYGYWGPNYLRVLSELPGSRVVTVCDQRPERLGAVRRRFPDVQTTTDIEEALHSDGVDAAVVCTHATSHFQIARLCLESGKHVLVEKPVATTAADADALIALAQARARLLAVGHTFLYNHAVRKVKEYMTRKEIGQTYYLYSRRTNLGPIRTDINALWDLAPHDISIFNYLLDSTPNWVSAVGANVLRTDREDVGFISLGYPNGIVGHIHVSWADPHKVRELVVVGSNMRIVFDDLQAMEQVRVFEKGVAPATNGTATSHDPFPSVRDGDIISPRIEPGEPLRNQCSHFLECINAGTQPLTSGWEGRAVVQVLEAIDQSLAHNGLPVSISEGITHEHLSADHARTIRRPERPIRATQE